MDKGRQGIVGQIEVRIREGLLVRYQWYSLRPAFLFIVNSDRGKTSIFQTNLRKIEAISGCESVVAISNRCR